MRFESDLGQHFGGGLYEAELRYLVAEEWAVTADDVVWRRSKLGLVLGNAEVEAIAAFMAAPSSQQRVAAE